MVDLVMLQVVRDLVAIFGVIAGLSYYVMNVSNSQRMHKMTLQTRQAQLFMQVYDRWASNDLTNMEFEFKQWEWDDYDDYIIKYYSDLEYRSLSTTLGKYYEGIGVLVKRGL